MFARLITLGLAVGVCFALVKAMLPGEPLPPPVPAVADALPPVTIVDVARSATSPADLARAMRLGVDEQVIAVNDLAVPDALAGEVILDAARTPGRYLDLTVRGARGERRLLVLVH